jgi:hypothetical protein
MAHIVPGATVLTKYYRHSVADFVEAVYPEHDWIPWKFPSIANGFWNKPAHHKLFLEWATKQLGYTKLDDWYQCDTMTLHKLGGMTKSVYSCHRVVLKRSQ